MKQLNGFHPRVQSMCVYRSCAFRSPARSGDGKRAFSAIEVAYQAARPLGGGSGGRGSAVGLDAPTDLHAEGGFTCLEGMQNRAFY